MFATVCFSELHGCVCLSSKEEIEILVLVLGQGGGRGEEKDFNQLTATGQKWEDTGISSICPEILMNLDPRGMRGRSSACVYRCLWRTKG